MLNIVRLIFKEIIIKKKILTIITKLELGGAQQVALNTIRHLPKDQFQGYLISGQGGLLDEEARQLEDVSVQLWTGFKHPVRLPADLLILIKLYRFIKKEKIDVVHTHSSKAGLLGRLAAHWAKVPKIIHTIHGWPFHEHQNWIMKILFIFLERLSASMTHHLIAVSEATKNKGLKYGIGQEQQYQVIFPGSDLKAFGPGIVDGHKGLRETFQISGYPPIVAMIANLKPQKAPIEFVRVAQAVHAQLPEVRFLLVGDGLLRKQVAHEIINRKLEDVVILAGWRKDIPAIMRGINILALTSLWEGLPCVFGQAMKTGLPIVATDVEGAREAVQDHETGFLVPIKDPQAMAKKIITILEDSSLRIRLGKAAMKQAGRFEIETMVKQVIDLYQQ